MGSNSNSTGQSIVNSTLGGVPIIGNFIQGQQANSLAQAQGNIAEAQLGQQTSDRNTASSVAAPTAQEIQELGQAVTTNNTDISRKQNLLNSADPSYIEAGKQALSLLQGGDSSVNSAAMQPIQASINNQRSQLQAQLQAQLGPGWQNSSAGIQAMQNFEANATSTLNNTRLSTLNQLMGYNATAEQNGNVSSNISNDLNINTGAGANQSRQVSAIEGTPITMSGAPFVAQANSDTYGIQQAQGASQTLGNLYGAVASNNGGTGKTNPVNGSTIGGASAAPMWRGGKVRGYANGGMIQTSPNLAASSSLEAGVGPNFQGATQMASQILPMVAAAARGGRIPGRAPYNHDTPLNDLMTTMLTPGEVVVDLNTLKKGPRAEAAFVEKAKRQKVASNAKR